MYVDSFDKNFEASVSKWGSKQSEIIAAIWTGEQSAEKRLIACFYKHSCEIHYPHIVDINKYFPNNYLVAMNRWGNHFKDSRTATPNNIIRGDNRGAIVFKNGAVDVIDVTVNELNNIFKNNWRVACHRWAIKRNYLTGFFNGEQSGKYRGVICVKKDFGKLIDARITPKIEFSLECYYIGFKPIYHTGVRIFGKEYSFWDNNKVKIHDISNGDTVPFKHFRTSKRYLRKGKKEIMKIVEEKVQKYNKLRYSLLTRNCNIFADELLRSLGVEGVDAEYKDSSGLRKIVERVPGVNTMCELFKKCPKIDQSVWDDIACGLELNKNEKESISKTWCKIKDDTEAELRRFSQKLPW